MPQDGREPPAPSSIHVPRFSLAARRASFVDAIRGVRIVVATQHNAWIHAAASCVVIVAGLAFRLDGGEWLAVVLAMGGVWTAEAINTAIEVLCDAVAPEQNPRIGIVKDVGAGAVLLAAIAATVVAAIVFGPRVLAAIGPG